MPSLIVYDTTQIYTTHILYIISGDKFAAKGVGQILYNWLHMLRCGAVNWHCVSKGWLKLKPLHQLWSRFTESSTSTEQHYDLLLCEQVINKCEEILFCILWANWLLQVRQGINIGSTLAGQFLSRATCIEKCFFFFFFFYTNDR